MSVPVTGQPEAITEAELDWVLRYHASGLTAQGLIREIKDHCREPEYVPAGIGGFCGLCGSTNPDDLGKVIGICLDATACHQRQYARLRDRADRAEAERDAAAVEAVRHLNAADAEIARLRSELEHAKAALAGDHEGIRLWMLDCGELVAKHRARAEAAEARLAEVRDACRSIPSPIANRILAITGAEEERS